MKFKQPTDIKNLEATWNGAIGIGYIEKITKREENGTEVTEDFLKKIEREDGTVTYLFQANLKAGNTPIRLQAWNSENYPTRAKDLANTINEGDYVRIEGSFSQREYNGNIYNQINVFKVHKTTEKENQEMYVSTQLQGVVDALGYDEEADLFKMVLTMQRRNGNGFDEYRVVGEPSNPYVKWLMEKTPSVQEGDVIKIGCDYRNELVKDRYGAIEDVVNRLELGKVYAYHSVEDGLSTTKNNFPF